MYAVCRLSAISLGDFGAAQVFADGVFGHTGLFRELGGGQAGGGGELLQVPAELAGDGVPHAAGLAGSFSAHGDGG
jgi:hypothetical protein